MTEPADVGETMRNGNWADKWTEFELARVNRGLVARKKKLSTLLKEASPCCETRDGETYEFDLTVLRRLSAAIDPGEDLLLPITLYFVSDSRDSCYVSDETAAIVLRKLEAFGEAYPYRDGRMWLPNSLAYTLIQKYPTAIQGLFL